MNQSVLFRNAKRLLKQTSSLMFRWLRIAIEKQNSELLAKFSIKIAAFYLSLTGNALPYFLRMQVDFLQIRNPFENKQLPEIEVLIPCTSKDFEILHYSLDSVIRFSQNPISKVTLVAPSTDIQEAADRFPEVNILSDEQVLSSSELRVVNDTVPQHRRGWALQQLIKISFTRRSKSKGVLIWDSDTILTLPTIWMDANGKQLLMFSHEYHIPYVTNTENFWGKFGASKGMSFVTHHQLMMPNILNEMFPDQEQSLIRWIESCDWDTGSAFSEYHSYGTWISNSYPELFEMGVWGNQADFRGNLILDFKTLDSLLKWSSKKHPGARSISLHAYLN